MKRMNVIVVFDKDIENVLMCKRAKDPYKGLYNLVGGKIEDDNSLEEAYRELLEETAISKNDISIEHFMDFTYIKWDMELEVYYGVLKHDVTLVEEVNKLGIKLTKRQLEQLEEFYNLLIEYNEKINLTAIIEPKEIIIKHFVDSLTISKYVNEKSKLIDVGTGAGFPGIPLKIFRDDIDITLVDSLNKRIKFLEEVINKLNLVNIKAVHGRAEEIGRNKEYREKDRKE